MNRLEFKNIIKSVLTSNYLVSTNDNYYLNLEETYCFNALQINFSGSYYAVVKGRIPLKIMNELYNDGIVDCSSVRFGEYGTGDPNEYAIDDIYKRDIRDIVDNFKDVTGGLERYQKAKERLLKRKENRKYVEVLYIEDKEVLMMLLLKMRNYYNRDKSQQLNEKKEYESLISNFKVNIDTQEDVGAAVYLEDLEVDNELIRDNIFTWMCMIKRVVSNFDKVVNPYINDEVELDDILNYMYKVDITKNCSDTSNEMHITDRVHGNRVSYYNCGNITSYELNYLCLDGDLMTVTHTQTGYREFGQKKINEQLKITYNNSNRNFNVRIDLTNGQAVLGNLEVKLSTRLLRLIYEEMLNAIEYASEVTINNMKRSKKVRSLKK